MSPTTAAAAAGRRATEHTRRLAELHRQLGAADHEREVRRPATASPTAAGHSR